MCRDFFNNDAFLISEVLDLAVVKVTDHRVLLGLKLHMGDRTLQQTDRTGATLDIVSPLANPTSPLMFFD
jgi:hypothetical protein